MGVALDGGFDEEQLVVCDILKAPCLPLLYASDIRNKGKMGVALDGRLDVEQLVIRDSLIAVLPATFRHAPVHVIVIRDEGENGGARWQISEHP